MNEEKNIKPDEAKTKVCPQCKKEVDITASKCPYCQSDLSVGGNLAKVLTSGGILLIIFVTIPIIMFGCGMCSIG